MTGSAGPRAQQVQALAAHLDAAFRLVGPADGGCAADELPRSLHRLAEQRPADVDDLHDRYLGTAAGTGADEGPVRQQQPPAETTTVGWFREHVWNAPGGVFVAVTGLATAAYVVFRVVPGWQVPVLQGFAVLLLALLPGFLYLRFIKFRLRPLCDEYVYNLHRLGVDEARHLPEPPRPSAAWQRWYDTGGPGYRRWPSIYQAKFVSQYGRWPASAGDEHRETLTRLASVYLCTATLAVGWAAVVWTAPVVDGLPRLADALRAGFLGAYFFLLSALIRRYFQNDLRPGAYLGAVVRVVTVLVLVAGVDQVFAMAGVPAGAPHPTENAVAFLVGVFPTVGVQLLRRAVGKVTGHFRGGLEPPFPLSQLDGMDIWSESRLVEVGIEDVQHLATANLVDVALGARIPTQRVVDWVDQALLVLHTGLPRTDNLRQPTTYGELRALGVRTATDLLQLSAALSLCLCPDGRWPGEGSPLASLAVVPPPPDTRSPALTRLACTPLLTRMTLATATLRHAPNLRLLQNWYHQAPEGDDAAVCSGRLPAADGREGVGGW